MVSFTSPAPLPALTTPLSNGLMRSPAPAPTPTPDPVLIREGQSLLLLPLEPWLALRVNKEETYDDDDDDAVAATTASPDTPDTLLLREEVVVEGRDGIGGGGCCGGGKLPVRPLLLKLKLLAFFVPLPILSPTERAGSGGASLPSPPSVSVSEVLPCFFLNAKSYMSPKIPAKVFLRFFIVSSASSTTDDCDWTRPPAEAEEAVAAWERLADEVVEDCDA